MKTIIGKVNLRCKYQKETQKTQPVIENKVHENAQNAAEKPRKIQRQPRNERAY